MESSEQQQVELRSDLETLFGDGYAVRVHDLMMYVLSDETETEGEGTTITEGVSIRVVFNVSRLEESKAKILSLVQEIVPDDFKRSFNGGFSFACLTRDRNGELWGDQISAESLFMLASGVGAAGFCSPRETWDVFPFGLPYVWFDPEAVLD